MNDLEKEETLPLSPVYRLIKKAGAEAVETEAIKLLRDYLERLGIRISERAVELAKQEGRKTVKTIDIILATVQ